MQATEKHLRQALRNMRAALLNLTDCASSMYDQIDPDVTREDAAADQWRVALDDARATLDHTM